MGCSVVTVLHLYEAHINDTGPHWTTMDQVAFVLYKPIAATPGLLHDTYKFTWFMLESDRSHDEARYRLPDNYVILKPITDADNRCLVFVNPDAQRPLVLSPLGPCRLQRSKEAADVSFRGGAL